VVNSNSTTLVCAQCGHPNPLPSFATQFTTLTAAAKRARIRRETLYLMINRGEIQVETRIGRYTILRRGMERQLAKATRRTMAYKAHNKA
jgi:hypothetical protein